jgi:hypothetical protein
MRYVINNYRVIYNTNLSDAKTFLGNMKEDFSTGEQSLYLLTFTNIY